MGFFGSLFGGSSPELNTLIKQYGKIGTSLTGAGQSYTGKAGQFWSDILGGESSKQMQALAPEISAAKSRTAEDIKTGTIFGTRSGGTAASTAAARDKLHADITSMIGGLVGGAASNLASLGTTMTSTGLTSLGMEQTAAQQRMQNWANSILGKGITGAVQAGEALGMGAIGGALPGGPGAAAGAQGAFASYMNA